jgi:hypothetical protein
VSVCRVSVCLCVCVSVCRVPCVLWRVLVVGVVRPGARHPLCCIVLWRWQVLPLQNKEPLVGVADAIAAQLSDKYKVDFDASSSIGVSHGTCLIDAPTKPCYRSVTTVPRCSSCFSACGASGKRYRRQDEVGTPFCITVDHDTVKDQTVTVRCRDTMKQVCARTQCGRMPCRLLAAFRVSIASKYDCPVQVRLPIQQVVSTPLTKASLGLVAQ